MSSLEIGTFSHVIGGSDTELLLASFATQIGGSGRFEQRDPIGLLPLRGVTVAGTASNSIAAFLDPSLATYADARDTYYDRLNTLATTALLHLPLPDDATFHPLLPGPYGSIIVHVTNFEMDWIVLETWGGGPGWNVGNEINDGAAAAMRHTAVLNLPVSKYIMAGVLTGAERSAGVGKGAVLYLNCPSSWGAVTDPNSYIFRDDFMGASLDTATVWTRAQSTAGNVEIRTAAGVANWCAVKGNDNWGANGVTSQATTARSAGKIFECDVFTGSGTGATTAGAPNLIVGWMDGAGVSFSDFSHGVDFTQTGSRDLAVYEGGTNRGSVGAGYSLNTIYRVRITLGASDATYEIQGGPEYEPIGGAAWDDITPGTTSNSTTPLSVGFTQYEDSTTYVGDVRVY